MVCEALNDVVHRVLLLLRLVAYFCKGQIVVSLLMVRELLLYKFLVEHLADFLEI